MTTCWQSVKNTCVSEFVQTRFDGSMLLSAPLWCTPTTRMLLCTRFPSSTAVLTSAADSADANTPRRASSSIRTVPDPLRLLLWRPMIILMSSGTTVSSSTLLVPFHVTDTPPKLFAGASLDTWIFIVTSSSLFCSPFLDKLEPSRRYESVAILPVLAVVPDQPLPGASENCSMCIAPVTPKSIVNVSSRWLKLAYTPTSNVVPG